MTDVHTAQAVAAEAQELLTRLAGPGAVLREDQRAAIDALVRGRRRVLVVQRTGWGKSAVYFVATRLLRGAGAGPTLLVSPLLALMRDQIEAARCIGIAAETINSTNVDDWDAVTGRLLAGEVDLLLVSPERLNHPAFRARVLAELAGRVGLVVVDEAHCVSDWGHDFRPDYRRIADLLASLPPDTPVLATTATANDRVTADVAAQLGTEPLTLRGGLDRSSLHLAVQHLPGAPERLAWLARWISQRQGSGIVYCLTVAETERVAAWLRAAGVDAVAYSGQTDPAERERIEAALKANALACVVATSALGMGYDKPDLRFVVHLGMPSSPIAYYQAIGRAGRAVDRAEVVLVPTEADEAIWAYFEATAFPPREQVDHVLALLAAATGPVSTPALEQRANLGRGRLESMLKVLDVDGAVRRSAGGWEATGSGWRYDADRLGRVAAARRAEREAMRRYARTDGCLMRFLRAQLDDPAGDCGRCAGCTGRPEHLDAPLDLLEAARAFLRGVDTPLPPRRRWAAGLPDRRGAIARDRQAETGRALAEGATSAWGAVLGPLLAQGTPGAASADAASAGAASADAAPADAAPAGTALDEAALDAVVDGLVATLARWDWAQRPTWICPLPSRRRGPLIDSVARRLGALGRLPVVPALQDTGADRPYQETMANSTHQAANALAGLAVAGDVPAGPVLLLDDVTRSGWTLTVAADLLRAAGAGPVLPLVLQRR